MRGSEVVVSYDAMCRQPRPVDAAGRRVTKNDQRFVYNGYLQVANETIRAVFSDEMPDSRITYRCLGLEYRGTSRDKIPLDI